MEELLQKMFAEWLGLQKKAEEDSQYWKGARDAAETILIKYRELKDEEEEGEDNTVSPATAEE